MRNQAAILEYMMVGVMLFMINIASALPPEANACLSTILTKYPSSERIDEQVRELERSRPGLVQGILADFDLAIRTTLNWDYPFRSMPLPRGGLPVSLRSLHTPEALESWLKENANDPDRRELWRHTQEHLGDMSLEERPELPLVMMYTLLHGWHDWSAWNAEDERLKAVREKWPELHRIYAINELRRLRYVHAIGPLLATVANGSNSTTVRQEASAALRHIGNFEDVLDLYITWAVEAPNSTSHVNSLWDEIHMVAQRLQSRDPEKSRAYWEKHQSSDVPTLWFYARIAFDRSLPADEWNWVREAQEQWNYEHESDPHVRRLMELIRRQETISSGGNSTVHRLSLSEEEVTELRTIKAEIERLQQIIEERAVLDLRHDGEHERP